MDGVKPVAPAPAPEEGEGAWQDPLEGAPMVLLHVGGPVDAAGWDVLLLWSWDWLALVPAALGVMYAIGLLRWPTRRMSLRPWQPYCFFAGAAVLHLALVSPVAALDDDLFFVHMVQHLLLVLAGPPLLLLGSPTTPLLRALPSPALKGVVAPLMRSKAARRAYRTVTSPVAAWLLFAINLAAWHFGPGAYDAAVRSAGVHVLQHATFLATAMLFWMALVDPRPMRSRISYPARLLFSGAAMLLHVMMGAAITFQDRLLYDAYASGPRSWGITAAADQQAGGLIMWIAGDVVIAATLLITLLIWITREQEKRLAEERRADAALRSEAAGLAPRPGE